MVDCHTGGGTFVNGMRVREQALEPGDQIKIGETIFAYRDHAAAPDAAPAEPALLRACSLLFLFRALAMSRDDAPALHARSADRRAGRRSRAFLWRRGPARGELPRIARDVRRPAAACARRGRRDVSPPRSRLRKPANLSDHRDTLSAVATLAAAALENARDFELLRNENELLRERLDDAETGIVGETPLTQKLIQLIGRVAPQDTSVLILGESGTGKELVARALHRLSPRAARPVRGDQLRRFDRKSARK